MPSSLIFVGLVAAWLAVLVPMVAKYRQEVRRTGDGALAARVLHRGGSGIKLRRPGPAAGHRSNPDWRQPEHEETVVDKTAADDSMHDHPTQVLAITRTDEADHAPLGGVDEHEQYEQDEHRELEAPRRTGRGGYDPEADAVARMARYSFRQRVVLGLLIAAVLTAVLAGVAFSSLWTVHVLIDLGLVGYLAYLRRQVRIEENVRERRMARMGRARLGVHSTEDDEFGVVPQRLRRPGAVVLEIDDEDPAFDELDDRPYELPRASGQ
ncbi:gephyrin-like molybdotransferase receptor GlpR [Rhodococcus sp. X156]|uniref:divisome protein SepX/GlpR n=1 Tax=Rhodococcus sp. X156 TaxID=2499145 RepID=UPI000FDC7B38|nr:gephyrin-like molybdotransferase receptor GlpR [Rhodococcus sp. X156]